MKTQKAVEFLRAEREENGTFRYFAHEINRTVYNISAEDMYALAARLEKLPERPQNWEETAAYTYSVWCAEISSGEWSD